MKRFLTLPVLLLLAFAAGCDRSPTDLSRAEVAGTYHATTITVTEGGTTTDLLAMGIFIDVNLAANGTTTGRFFVPGGNEDNSDFDANLSGTWTLRGSTVEFDHAADTVLRDMTFKVSGNRLEGTANGATLRIILAK